MSAKDRVSTAAEATAASVRQIRPLALPEGSAVSAELRGHRGRNGSRVSGTLTKIRETWIIPLGAAAVVVALALTLVTFRQPEASSPASSTGGTSAAADPAALAAIPRYYAIATEGKESHEGKAAIEVTVGDIRTGKAIATVATPAVYVGGNNAAAGVSAAGDDRTFVVGSRNIYDGVAYYLVRIAPGTKQVATIEPLPIPQVAVGNLLGFAVSPDGKELAVLSVRGNGTTLRIYSVKSGATLRTWIAGTWQYQGNGIQQTGVSWTADSRQVAFSTVMTTGGNRYSGVLEERLVEATAPSGDLAAASKVALKAPGNCSSLLLTPDGGTVVCATMINFPPATSIDPHPGSPGVCGKDGPMFVAYSATTGQRLRVLYQYTGTCDFGVDTVLWADNSARHVIGENMTVIHGNPPRQFDYYGVAAAGKFARFQIAQHGQYYSGPGF
jgi:hypothetical protein